MNTQTIKHVRRKNCGNKVMERWTYDGWHVLVRLFYLFEREKTKQEQIVKKRKIIKMDGQVIHMKDIINQFKIKDKFCPLIRLK